MFRSRQGALRLRRQRQHFGTPSSSVAEALGYSVAVAPLHQELTRRAQNTFLVLLGSAGLVLLIACAKCGESPVVSAAELEKELVLRMALGATRARLAAPETNPANVLLLEELKIGWTLGMLLCLDRPHRLSLHSRDILELDHHQEAAAVLEISPAAYRKRLSRARGDLVAFLRNNVVSSRPQIHAAAAGACRMLLRRAALILRGRCSRSIVPGPKNSRRFLRRSAVLKRSRATALYRSHPERPVPEDFALWIRRRFTRYTGRHAGETAHH